MPLLQISDAQASRESARARVNEDVEKHHARQVRGLVAGILGAQAVGLIAGGAAWAVNGTEKGWALFHLGQLVVIAGPLLVIAFWYVEQVGRGGL